MTTKCMQCKKNLRNTGNYYMLHDELWNSITSGYNAGELCLSCVEKRLHRELTRSDFAITPVMLAWKLTDRSTQAPDDNINWRL